MHKQIVLLLAIFVLCACTAPTLATPAPTSRSTPTQTERAALRAELVDMLEEDQAALAPQTITAKEFNEINERHVQRLEEIIDRYGWPTIPLVGEEASSAAFIIVQHADRDLVFQKKILTLIEPLAAQGEIRPANYAYLYDRIAIAEDRPQRYAT